MIKAAEDPMYQKSATIICEIFSYRLTKTERESFVCLVLQFICILYIEFSFVSDRNRRSFANNISLLKQSINLDSRKILKFEILNADRDILLKTASIGKLLTKRR